MATLTAKDVKAIRETHDKVIKIMTLLKGNGGEGLLQKADNNRKRITRVEIIIAAILGSGALGGGAYGLIQLIGG